MKSENDPYKPHNPKLGDHPTHILPLGHFYNVTFPESRAPRHITLLFGIFSGPNLRAPPMTTFPLEPFLTISRHHSSPASNVPLSIILFMSNFCDHKIKAYYYKYFIHICGHIVAMDSIDQCQVYYLALNLIVCFFLMRFSLNLRNEAKLANDCV